MFFKKLFELVIHMKLSKIIISKAIKIYTYFSYWEY